eukprot:gnl/TRDRNA2_/TRDRNA2_55788_c0_seq1.p1 gnl/TRDRNA2_/TRDRNA2_55788_c0~~gnl/TRDRNA2_/TRDRNA2_55788_c0_seq1.p1  ORF type:complete len:317 (-),score=56.19 gnl/TRDRNA2_/TRDRNA2_55788_c0_seq1:156-1106(-)
MQGDNRCASASYALGEPLVREVTPCRARARGILLVSICCGVLVIAVQNFFSRADEEPMLSMSLRHVQPAKAQLVGKPTGARHIIQPMRLSQPLESRSPHRQPATAVLPIRAVHAATEEEVSLWDQMVSDSVNHATFGKEVGVLVYWNAEKGFGFVRPEENEGVDLFCHHSRIEDGEDSVRRGDEVLFRREYNERMEKWDAVDVEMFNAGPALRGDDYEQAIERVEKENEIGIGEPGIVVHWNTDRGFGFIQPDKEDGNIFCHMSALMDGLLSLKQGDKVTFKRDFNDVTGRLQAGEVYREEPQETGEVYRDVPHAV